MKRISIILITILMGFILFGCHNTKDSTSLEDLAFEEEELTYEIVQILFSKGFQSIEPTTEILTNTKNNLKILASLGLTECSEVNINQIIKKGNEINIHVSAKYDKKDLRLAVPQVIMELQKSKLKITEDTKFNIVYDDYIPLKIKFSINDVLNKIQSSYKVSLKASPRFNLIKSGKDILWDISYNSIFDRDNPDIPLMNLSTMVNANTGDIIKSEKTYISSTFDDGNVINYVSNGNLLYKKTILDGKPDIKTEQLWFYDVANDEKSMVYSSNSKISSTQFSPDLKFVSLIETNEDISDLYIISNKDNRAYKALFEDKFNPSFVRWKDHESLYLLENIDNFTLIYSYNINTNSTKLINKIKKQIESFIVFQDKFLVVEKSEDSLNKKISLTTDWKRFKLISEGFSPKVIDGNIVTYLKKAEKIDCNSLIMYDLNEERIIGKIEDNIVSYMILSDNNIAYVKKNSNHNDFTLSKYLILEKTKTDIAHLISDKLYFDDNRDLVYLNIVLPFDNEKSEVIYSIDLNKIN